MTESKNEESGLNWKSIREKWTVTSALFILVLSFFLIAGAFIFAIVIKEVSLIDKMITILNAILMAVLGYLFGYIPAKTSEEYVKTEKEITDKEINKFNKAIINYLDIIEEKESIIRDYEIIISEYESET